jgi:hypothetical protein
MHPHDFACRPRNDINAAALLHAFGIFLPAL